MKPSDHPEFFQMPPPAGTSRESSLRLDREGRFWHEDALVEHPKLLHALHGWIQRHPDNGRYILANGYDWTYFQVEDTPFFVRSLSLAQEPWQLELSDGAIVPFEPTSITLGDNGAVYLQVQHKGERFEAKMSRHAQLQLEPLLEETVEGQIGIRTHSGLFVPPARS